MIELAREWMRKGDNDLLNVENNLKGERVPTDTVCFHCQQVAEKYLKAYLVLNNIQFGKIHNLLRLLELCKAVDASFEQLRDQLVVINDYAVEIRYPDTWFEPELADALEAYEIAKQVKAFVSSRMNFPEEKNEL